MKMSIGKKLNLSMLLVVVVAFGAFLTLGVTAVNTARESFVQSQFEQLSAIREIKKNQIEGFFQERQGDLAVLTATVGALRDGLKADDHIADLDQLLARRYDGFMTDYQRAYGYYDLFLISPDGYCFYSVEKESDYQTNLLTGPYRDSNLGQLVRRVRESRAYALADFAPYAPSNGEPAAFIAQPLLENGEVTMIVALQLSLEAINAIMQERTGMGQTGETYLVGSDQLMRSDSFLDPTHHSVIASFADPGRGRVDTAASRAALAGNSGAEIVIDYTGNPVLSAYTPVQVNGHTWALLAEIDEREVRNDSVAARALLNRVLTIGGLAGLVMAVCIVINGLVTRKMVGVLNRISHGLNDGAAQVGASSNQVAASGQELAEGASEQAASLEETSASLEEISSMTKQNADNAGQANVLMREAGEVVQRAEGAMAQLTTAMAAVNQSSEETSKIVKTIDEIAFQTNLLALNAAVEAARAGEAGAGFAVVADEVRNLAMRAAEAAKNTAELINDTVIKVQEGSKLVDHTGTAFSEVASSTRKASGLVGEIAAASNEQSNGIGQLNTAMGEMDQVVQRTAANAEESAAAAEELSAMAAQMEDYVGELMTLITGDDRKPMGSRGASAATKPKGPALPQPLKKPAAKETGKSAKAANAPARLPSGKPKGRDKAAEAIPFDDDDFKDF